MDPVFPLDPDSPDADLAAECVFYSTRLANVALSRIHIGTQLVNIAEDQTQEAFVCRQHFTQDLNETLEMFPWPFATRYASLVLVGGTATVPVNGDWQYSYRAPADLRKARRLVNPAGTRRGPDPNPIAFRMGADDDGPLLYTDLAATLNQPVELEYTCRPLCPAKSGSTLFRSAAEWRLAASLAGPLARDKALQTLCLQAYAMTLRQAEVGVANEQQFPQDGDAAWISGR